MSGLEILGIAASVIQIADAGARLSSKLFVFTRKVKNADRAISEISQEIATTGAALRQLGEALEQDKYARLGSRHSIDTTSQIMADCWKVFTDINDTIGGEAIIKDGASIDEKGSTSTRLSLFSKPSFRLKQRLKFPYIEPQIMLLKSKLESLKSSLMLMLQVLMLAEQVRNRPQATVTEEQKALIQTLIEERNEKEKEFKTSCLAIENAAGPTNVVQETSFTYQKPKSNDPSSLASNSSLISGAPMLSQSKFLEASQNPIVCMTAAVPKFNFPPPNKKTERSLPQQESTRSVMETASTRSRASTTKLTPTVSTETLPDEIPAVLRIRQEEIEHHSQLVQNLLEEISDVQYRIDHGIRHRMHDGVLKTHWDEWSPYAQQHGYNHFLDAFERNSHQHVSRFWVDQRHGERTNYHVSPALPAEGKQASKKDQPMIKFVDAILRTLNLPFESCRKWDDMEATIARIFAPFQKYDEVIHQGQYDLVGLDGAIILPIFWESTVEAGMEIKMVVWPNAQLLPSQPVQRDPNTNDPRYQDRDPRGDDTASVIVRAPPSHMQVPSPGKAGGEIPIVAAGLGTAAVAGLYDKKTNKAAEDITEIETNDGNEWNFMGSFGFLTADDPSQPGEVNVNPQLPFEAPRLPGVERKGHEHMSTGDASQSPEHEKSRCPYPDCGRAFKDLAAHILTHEAERPEKCPMPACEYNTKGFARKYDKNRHALTHFKGTMVCGFCPGLGTALEKTFNRVDVFKRHLVSVHGVEQVPPNSRKASKAASGEDLPSDGQSPTASCSVCSRIFLSAESFYEHLDECVLDVVMREAQTKAADTSDTQSVRVPRKHSLTEEQVEDLREVFSLFDKDGKGYLSAEAVPEMMRSLGQNPTDAEIRELMGPVDSKLDFDGFLNHAAALMKAEGVELESTVAFKTFDKDAENSILAEDFRTLLKDLEPNLTDAEIDEMVAEAETEAGGLVEYEQFVETISFPRDLLEPDGLVEYGGSVEASSFTGDPPEPADGESTDTAIDGVKKELEREKALVAGGKTLREASKNPALISRLDSQIRDGERTIASLEERLRNLQVTETKKSTERKGNAVLQPIQDRISPASLYQPSSVPKSISGPVEPPSYVVELIESGMAVILRKQDLPWRDLHDDTKIKELGSKVMRPILARLREEHDVKLHPDVLLNCETLADVRKAAGLDKPLSDPESCNVPSISLTKGWLASPATPKPADVVTSTIDLSADQGVSMEDAGLPMFGRIADPNMRRQWTQFMNADSIDKRTGEKVHSAFNPGPSKPTNDLNLRPSYARRSTPMCRNCRLRKVVCSGDQPACTQCNERGLSCDYNPGYMASFREDVDFFGNKLDDGIRDRMYFGGGSSTDSFWNNMPQNPSKAPSNNNFQTATNGGLFYSRATHPNSQEAREEYWFGTTPRPFGQVASSSSTAKADKPAEKEEKVTDTNQNKNEGKTWSQLMSSASERVDDKRKLAPDRVHRRKRRLRSRKGKGTETEIPVQSLSSMKEVKPEEEKEEEEEAEVTDLISALSVLTNLMTEEIMYIADVN